MSIVTKMRAALGGKPRATPRQMVEIPVRCRRCGEVLTATINLGVDLSIDYERNQYTVRKLVSGNGANRCFQTVELWLTFDDAHHLIDRQIVGGDFVDATGTA